MELSESATPWTVPLVDVAVDEEIARAVHETVMSGWWSTGPRVAEFEERFREYTGVRNALAVASGTAALHLALLATGCGPGDEVILPSLNFVAAANVVAHTGATPVFCDVRGPTDLNLSVDDVAAAVTPSTRAVLALHYGGFPCDLGAVLEVAARHGLMVIEDAAHAPGATWRGRKCGTVGNAGCFSFFSNKNLPVGEGGMVVTDDDDLAERIRLLRSHGMTTLTWDRHRGHAHSYDVVEFGFNYRLDEVRAAVGLVQLERLDHENALRARIAALYRSLLDGEKGIIMPFRESGDDTTSANHLAVLVLPEAADRSALQEVLRQRRIQTSVHYPPIHTFSRYRSLSRRALPKTDEVSPRLLTLPLYGTMEDGAGETVADAVLSAL